MSQWIEFVSASPMLSCAWVVLFGMLIYSFFSAKMRGFALVNAQEVVQLINREDAVVIDVRSIDAFRRGHVAGAKNLQISKIEQNPKTALEKHSSHPIILVCETGAASLKAAALLHKSGVKSVCALRGGMNEWLQANLPTVSK